ncbi:MAG: undecaprenyl diphosphate synthase family protein, partial [Sphingorhabdus sp.]
MLTTASQPVRIEAGTGKIPRHVAIIMDGNGRWAKKRMLPRAMGHKKGVETVRKVVRAAGELGLETLSLYAFSSDNWKRPED